MSLQEAVKAEMPEYVYKVTITDSDIHGLKAKKVVVNYNVHGKNMFLDMSFANKNHMTPEHIAAVVKSYLPNLGE